MNIKVRKKAELENTDPPLTAFQIGQARVKTQDAIKRLEFYSESIPDADFQQFLTEKMWGLCSKIAPQLVN